MNLKKEVADHTTKILKNHHAWAKKSLNEEEEEEDWEELTYKKQNGIPLSPEEEERLEKYNAPFGDELGPDGPTRMAEPDEMDYKPRGMQEGEKKETCPKCKSNPCKCEKVEESGRSDRPESKTNMQGQKEPQQMRRAASGKQLEEALKRITEVSKVFQKIPRT